MESLLGINQDCSQYSEPFFHLISKSKDGLKEQSISSLKKILYKAPNSLEQNEAKEVKDTEIIAKYRVDYFRDSTDDSFYKPKAILSFKKLNRYK